MGYCRKCGAKVDDLDAFCGNCGAHIGRGTQEDTEFVDNNADTNKNQEYTTPNGAKNDEKPKGGLDDIERTMNENIYAFLCFVLGICSFFVGFIAAIISLVFYKKGMEKCEKEGKPGADLCKIGKICSKVCIGIAIVCGAIGLIVSVGMLLFPMIFI